MHSCKPRAGQDAPCRHLLEQTPLGYVRPLRTAGKPRSRPPAARSNPLAKYFQRDFGQTAIINATLTSKTHRTSTCGFAIEKSTSRNGAILRLGKQRFFLLAKRRRDHRIRLSKPERIPRTRRKRCHSATAISPGTTANASRISSAGPETANCS